MKSPAFAAGLPSGCLCCGSFKSSGGSRYCSAGEGNPATTDPATFALAELLSSCTLA
mgnify:CR=1 FL=1